MGVSVSPDYEFNLPYPPSINSYWRRRGAQYFIAAKGREFRKAVREKLVALGIDNNTEARLNVRIIAYVPDRRRRDIDNILKATLDALEHGGFMKDDSQIDILKVVRGDVIPGGLLNIKVTEIDR